MPEILKPLTFEDMPTRPPLVGRPRISDDLQQTVALLTGWDSQTRRLIRCSPTGVLYVSSAPVKGIANLLSAGDGTTQQGGDIDTSEVLIRAKPTNSGRVWVNVGVAAAVDVGYPLDSGEPVIWSVNNLHNLHFYFTKAADKVIVVYTK